MDLIVDFRFCAAHRLPLHPGRCQRLHGHSYRGMVVDFYDVEAAVGPVVKAVDGSCLNDVLRTPTAEAISVYLWRLIAPHLAGLRELRLFETDDCHVVYRGEPIPAELIAPGEIQEHPSTAPEEGAAGRP